ncbi:gp16 family phage-associated protein [Sphingobium sp. B1D7B]|uniref:DNA-binding protein n=1 Tax=unclassified Sphingobium TaxID=2611147 RepID=UPI0039B375AB|nr:gp16 family phage-associated protein [Sphingobium sp. B11D3A]MCW2406152.1 gp16 family phage-associated protein [Sphingobium sp. B1D7B]
MSGPGVSRSESFTQRIYAVRKQFAASGISVTKWAMDRGFNPTQVHNVLSGKRRCVRGESHRIAVALGVKEDVPPPGEPLRAAPERIEGVRG